MRKFINGHTFESVMEAIKTRNNNTRAWDYYRASCVYKTEGGNCCFVGCFIPEGHEGQRENYGVSLLLRYHPDLESNMPLSKSEMIDFQTIHDRHGDHELDKYPHLSLYEKAEKFLKGEIE